MLMSEIKHYATYDNCDILLECISSATTFFKRQKFENTNHTSYRYPRKQSQSSKSKSLFIDYKLIKKQREEEMEETIRKEIASFQKFLHSPLFNDIKNMI